MKPIVFLSHSSKDESSLGKLKTMLTEKTGNSIEFFLSSDGQSIPLGRNWIHRIEEALNNAKIVFVILSPESIQSKWVYFESGFSYARGIKVIPIGVGGVDLQKLSPPLSLLQGFNIHNADGLNNLINIFNKEFEFCFPESFIENDYLDIFSSPTPIQDNGLGKFTPFIKSLFFPSIPSFNNALSVIQEYFAESKLQYTTFSDGISSYGISINIDNKKIMHGEMKISLDPSLTKVTLPIVKKITRKSQDETQSNKSYLFDIFFKPIVSCIKTPYSITSRFYNTDVKFDSPGLYGYKNLKFYIQDQGSSKENSQVYMQIRYAVDYLDTERLMDLLILLFEKEILYINESLPE